MKCIKCSKEVSEKECYCGICYINKLWEIEKLEKVKKIIDEILKLSKLDTGENPYSKNDYTYLFDEEDWEEED